ncbi:hypothetical protein ILUMI_06997 [Ignelater luminosus]|uniref:VWFA domain-containing protein n=1 Tax=Ignelater luminosus TaxID=2038154 RepID=A0A8K0D8X3_IGNLU|nr:hypothetical protein ILUMI_06997 [Ignelater luminosus]
MLFSERVAWFEASSICKTYEAHLCMPNSTSKANFVAYFLSESLHYHYEDFWIGGRKMKEQWMWLDGQLIRNSNISVLWPWNVSGCGKDCLGIERHKHRTPMLVGLSCYLPKPFICERALSARTNRPLPSLPAQSIKIESSIFTFYHSKISWSDALAFCRSLGQRLAVLPNNKVVRLLTSEICERRRDLICEQYFYSPEPIHIDNSTIECIYDSTIMYINLIDMNWTEAKQICHDNDTILAEPRDNETAKAIAVCLGDHPAACMDWSSLPWCEDEFEKDSTCLNLDRTDHDVPWIYGLQCKRKQPFVCEIETIITTTEKTTTEMCDCQCTYPSVSMYYINETYVAFMFKIEQQNIFQYCKYFGGKPYAVNFPMPVHRYVLAYIRLTLEHCHPCCTNDMIDFLIIDKYGNTCNLINLGTNQIRSNVPDCEVDNYFLCQTQCTPEPALPANENATIDCPWIQAVGKIPYKSCKFRCGSGYTIFGPDRFICDYYGWAILRADGRRKLFLFPECIRTQNSAKELIKVINKLEPKGLYFVVNEREEMERSKWMTLLQFVASIIQVYPLSEDFPFGMLTYSNHANVRISNATDTCQVLDKLRSLEKVKHAKGDSYNKAFIKAESEIKKYQSNRRNLIFMLVDRENRGPDYEDTLIKLKKDNDIIVIGVTIDTFIFDLDLVASLGRTYRLHSIKVIEYAALTNISLDLLTISIPIFTKGYQGSTVVFFLNLSQEVHLPIKSEISGDKPGQ